MGEGADDNCLAQWYQFIVTRFERPSVCITVDSPIPPLSGLAKKREYYIINQEKTYPGLENQRRYKGGQL